MPISGRISSPGQKSPVLFTERTLAKSLEQQRKLLMRYRSGQHSVTAPSTSDQSHTFPCPERPGQAWGPFCAVTGDRSVPPGALSIPPGVSPTPSGVF